MLAPSPPVPPDLAGPDPERVARAYAGWVRPCGAEPINRLEFLLERKFALVQAFGAGGDGAPDLATLLGVLFVARAHREAIATSASPDALREVVRRARAGSWGPGGLPALAERVRGAPPAVGRDVTAELVHAAAPDRFGLWTRWVWNPARATGVLGEFVTPGPSGPEGVQAALGGIRLALAGLGFPSPTFAAVDILLALTHAQRLARASEESLKGGGTESLLPGPYGIASMILGVRPWVIHADR